MEKLILPQSRNSPHFGSRSITTASKSPPLVSNLSHINSFYAPPTPIHPFSWRSILMLSSHFRLAVSCLLAYPQKHSTNISCLPYAPHVPSIHLFLIWSPEWYVARSTNHGSSHYAVFPSSLFPRPSWAQNIFLSTLFSSTLDARLTNLWHSCPKWHAERFPWHEAFTAVPVVFFKFLLSD